jgi:hypothetical protein
MDLISRKAVIEEIQLIEKSLMKDKEEAKKTGDEEIIFAIDSQLSGLWLARCKVGDIKIAYDVDKVVEDIQKCGKSFPFGTWHDMLEEAVEIVKGGFEE